MDNKGIELAYLAGILDGDGSFSLVKGKARRLAPIYYPMIQLANVSKELIEYFKSTYGGYTGTRLAYKAADGGMRKECYYWKLKHADQCLSFLENVIPYLVIKKERASFLRDYIVNRPSRSGSTPLGNEELKLREWSYVKMMSFNDHPDISGHLLAKSKQINSESKEFWSYVAGIIDTDGSLSIKKEDRTSKGRKNATYTPIVLLSMTDCRAIYYMMNNFFGANLHIVKAKTAFNGFCYRFSITAKSIAQDFLKKCIPFLLIKKEQAKILLEFCDKAQSIKCRMKGIPEDEVLFRESCYLQIIKCNKYGVSKSSLMDLKLLPGSAEDNKAEGVSHRERSKREEPEMVCGALNSMET